eukprot:gene7686-12152_t
MRKYIKHQHQILKTTKLNFNSNINFKTTFPSDFKTSKKITKSDCLLNVEEYKTKFRKDAITMRRKIKNERRLNVGPFSSIVFENYDTLFVQIHEMVCIEFGNEDSFDDEIEAYESLLPDGKSLVAVFMIEIENEKKRLEKLKQLSYIENFIALEFENEKIKGIPINPDRTDENGKTSSIHFLKFNFSSEQIEKFKNSKKVSFSIEHENYSHSTLLPSQTVKNVSKDFE